MATGSGVKMITPGLTINSRRVVTSTDSADAEQELGSEITLNDGRKYKYYNAREAIAVGQIVTILNVDDADVDASASDNTLTGTGDFTSGEFNENSPDRREYYVATNAGAGALQVRRIRSNTANVLTLDSSWSTAIDTTTDYVTFGPYHVNLTSGVGQRVFGVAISAVSSGNNSWFQVGGFCPLVRADGSVDAIALHEGLVSSATSGVAKGLTTAGTTTDEAEKAFGSALMPTTNADVAGRGIPAHLNRIV